MIARWNSRDTMSHSVIVCLHTLQTCSAEHISFEACLQSERSMMCLGMCALDALLTQGIKSTANDATSMYHKTVLTVLCHAEIAHSAAV